MVEAAEPNFVAFPEIENHYNKSVLAYVEEHKTDETVWVATEKIHGTNFCFIHDGSKLTCAKRTSLLAEKTGFMNFQVIAKKYETNVKSVFDKLKSKKRELTHIRVFGEFYGGIYPGVTSKNKPIQDSVVYCPELEFEAFDLFYDLSTDAENVKNVLNYKEAVELFKEAELPHAVILMEGPVNHLIEKLNPNTMESTIPAKHGLQKVEGNMAEGYVLKPVDAMWDDEGARISIKYKNKHFLESKPKEKKPAPVKKDPKSAGEMTEEEKEIVDRAVGYCVKPRLENIISKLNDDERNEKTVVGKMMPDAWKDFAKAEDKEIVDKANKLKGKIMPLMKEECAKLFNDLKL